MPPNTPRRTKSVVKAEPEPMDVDEMVTPKAEVEAKTTPTRKRVRTKPPPKLSEVHYSTLPSTVGDAAPVDVTFEDAIAESKVLPHGGYGHQLKLHGTQPFKLVTSIMVGEGPYAGHQAILIQPSKPFRLLALPKNVLLHTYRYVLAPQGYTDGKIAVSGGTGNRNGASAKEYTAGQKPRLGLLLVNKEIHNLARPILYDSHFKCDNTGTLMTFLSQVGDKVRAQLSNIEVTNYQRANAVAAFSMLADCKNLKRLHISTGVALNSSPSKAAKAFYGDAYRFLEVMGSHLGKKDAGVDLLRFGKSAKCFSIKDGDEIRAWEDEEKLEFQELLRAKMQ